MSRSFRLALTVAAAWLVPATLALFATPAWSAALVQLEVQRDGTNGVDGLDGADGLAISPDGAYLYVASEVDGAVAVFRRSASGALGFVEAVHDGVDGVDGIGGAQAVAVSPDGAHLYVASSGTLANPGTDDAVAIFARDPGSGTLTFLAAVRDGQDGFDSLNGARALAISADGLFVYVASDVDHGVAILARDAASGLLTFVGQVRDGVNGVDGLHAARGLALSPAGDSLYVAGAEDDAVAVFSRDAVTGALTFVEMQQNSLPLTGLGRARSVVVSPDGQYVYVGGRADDAIVVFARDLATGALNFVSLVKDNENGVNGLNGVHALALSPDSLRLYAVGDHDNALALFDRDPVGGGLTFVQMRKNGSGGVSGLAEPFAVVVSPDGATVYTAGSADDAVAVFLTACGNGVVDHGEECDDGDNAAGDCCSPACRFDAPASACTDDNDACTDDVCNGAGLCQHPNNTAPCDDGLFCTVNDVCAAGQCGGVARDCSGAADQCNDGICDEAKDRCAQPKPNGTACDDGSACTRTDKCKAGACVGSSPIVCAGGDQCNDAVCDPATGTCGSQPKADGSPCNDANACTQSDTCTAGGCVGSNPVVCSALDQCHLAGTCDTASGECSQPVKADASTCNDGDACTRTDTCTAGACLGSNPVVCSAPDQCHDIGTCNPSSGQCSNPATADGTPCDDGDQCTVKESCVAGSCTPATPAADADGDGVCDALDICGLYDPDQADADGDGVGDACECTQPAPGRCLPGGGNKRTDCLVEFNTAAPVAVNRAGTMVLNTLRCEDGDPRCDRDGQKNGQCTFGVTVCLANRDPRFPRCQASGVTRFEVLSPRPDKSKSSMDRSNALALESAVGRLGVGIVRKGRVLTAGSANAGGDSCTGLLELVAPVGKGKRPGVRVYKLRGDAASGRDLDRLRLECR
jgi:6-phosphogluconolactonase (cycloisomerase 2 family)